MLVWEVILALNQSLPRGYWKLSLLLRWHLSSSYVQEYQYTFRIKCPPSIRNLYSAIFWTGWWLYCMACLTLLAVKSLRRMSHIMVGVVVTHVSVICIAGTKLMTPERQRAIWAIYGILVVPLSSFQSSMSLFWLSFPPSLGYQHEIFPQCMVSEVVPVFM